MNQHLKDQLFAALSEEIAATPHDGLTAHQRHTRPVARALLGVAAAGALVAGVIVLLPGDDGADVSVAPAGSMMPASSDVPAEQRLFTFEPHQGTMYRMPTTVTDADAPPDTSSIMLGFKLTTTDQRLSGMTVSPYDGPSGMRTLVVATIGTRQIRTLPPESTTYPAGMTEATSTGPWFFTESDGTEWLATGLLSDLRAALPDVSYENSRMELGPTLVPWTTPAGVTSLSQMRDERFTLSIVDDSVTDLTIADLGAGRYELADVNGAPGAFFYGNRLAWRVDEHTVLELAATGGTPAEPAELLAVARTVRPTTQEELRTIPMWRGAQVERVIVKTNADRADLEAGGAHETVGVRIEDLDANDGGEVILSGPWSTEGVAIPLGAEKIGHEIRLTIIDPSDPSDPSDPATEPPGPNECSKVVVVPPESEPAAEVVLDVGC